MAGSNAGLTPWLLGVSLLKTIGLAVSVLLLMNSIDARNPFVQNLCSLGKKNNCNAILKSDAAKITDWLSWSEVGFFYFAGSLLALFMVPVLAGIIGILSLLALPYTIYSITYQYRTKNWCLLCCTVQALLWLEALTFLVAGLPSLPLVISPLNAFLLALSFFAPIAFWAFLKPFFIGNAQLKPLKKQLKQFKFNSQLFQQALTAQPRFAVPDALMAVELGNPAAETVITMVSNPFCGPCATTHKVLDNWLASRDDLKVKIVFTTADNDDDPRTMVSKHIAALSRHADKKLVETALNDWYNSTTKKYETWAAKYPVTFDPTIAEVTGRQKEWCAMAEVTATPTILVNGYKLPSPYQLEDIKYLMN